MNVQQLLMLGLEAVVMIAILLALFRARSVLGLTPLYVVTGGNLWVCNVGTGGRVSGLEQFAELVVDGVPCRTDGIRADVHGNLWCSSNGPAGYSGVTVWSSSGTLLGRIRLPEVCANVTFGGPKRNRLFMAASQSIYAVYVNTQGAAPG